MAGPGAGRTARPGAARRHRRATRILPALAALLLAGCTAPRIVPVPAPGIQIDAAQTTASVAGEGVELAVQGSAWRGSPWDLDDYVTPFRVSLTNGSTSPLHYEYQGFWVFDDSSFQYTALPPVEVERILRSRAEWPDRLAAISSPPPIIRRRIVTEPIWYPWAWAPYGWYDWPRYYRGVPFDDVYLHALAMGPLQPGARLEGFVYFPRLRSEARGLRLEFHHQVGDLSRVLTLSFAIARENAAP